MSLPAITAVLRGSRFLYFFIQPMWRHPGMKCSFWLGGIKQKKHEKTWNFWALNSYYKRSNWKIWLAERFSKALSFEIKEIHATESYRNGVKLNCVDMTPLWFYGKS